MISLEPDLATFGKDSLPAFGHEFLTAMIFRGLQIDDLYLCQQNHQIIAQSHQKLRLNNAANRLSLGLSLHSLL